MTTAFKPSGDPSWWMQIVLWGGLLGAVAVSCIVLGSQETMGTIFGLPAAALFLAADAIWGL